MRLLSLTVRNYRTHKDRTIHFDPARNLIGGPNESGKSTLVEAAHRALFLRAKTGGSLQKEMVSTLHLGDPEVLLVFEAEGTRWELEKRFAGSVKGSARLTAQGRPALRDDAAEAELARILKTEAAGGRGASGQLPLLWAHLWVWQGTAGENPSAHATRHKEHLIQRIQQGTTAALIQSPLDQHAAATIAERYAAHFTATGRPRAGSPAELAQGRLEEAEAALQQSAETAARLARASDDHTRAEREISEVTDLLPKLRKDLADADALLQKAALLRREEAIHSQAAQAAAARRAEAEGQDRTLRELQEKLLAQTAALQPADEKLAGLTEAAEAARTASQSAESAHQKAHEDFRHARLRHDIVQATVTAAEKSEVHERLVRRAAEAAEIQAEADAARTAHAKLPVLESDDLARLRKLETEVGQAEAALDAMATEIEVIDSPGSVLLDDKPIQPGHPRILTETAEVRIADGTRLRIRPGGAQSLAATRTRVGSSRAALISALQALSVSDVSQATSALEHRQALHQTLLALETRWKALGGDSLTPERTAVAAALQTSTEHLKRLKDLAATAGLALLDADPAAARDALAASETAESTARFHVDHCRRKSDAAADALVRHRNATAAARQALRDLETAIKTREETHGDAAARATALTALRNMEAQTASDLASTQKALAALNPDSLAADLDRFRRALDTQESRLREAETTRLLARDRLAFDGSVDPEAELQTARARRDAAREHHASVLSRARAIEKLHHLFISSREAVDRALVQPLAERISGYLQCLFGAGTEARVQLSESDIGGLELVRPHSPAFAFDALSGGAREQVAAATRLALAEILAADHDGTLPVLFDDAFAYSDPDRIQTLQRMLDLAATRNLQVIILTCTPRDYSGFGAAEVRLESSAAQENSSA